VAAASPDPLTTAIAAYADTHPCERECWLHPRLAHFDGRSWSHTPLPEAGRRPDQPVYSVTGPRDVWTVTDNYWRHLWHFDGADWVKHDLGAGARLELRSKFLRPMVVSAVARRAGQTRRALDCIALAGR
jgi:hypothetical protein